MRRWATSGQAADRALQGRRACDRTAIVLRLEGRQYSGSWQTWSMLRVAVIGSGPARVYAAGALAAHGDVVVDVIDRLPST